ncbi:MAG: radical SAM protein [Lachnospiraceae bacterium]|nr:radical SAM protein [Lachnospiraceae bacterium]
MFSDYSCCELCPRVCRADRHVRTGFCKAGDTIRLARAGLHLWEEPCLSGKNGSGAVFFSGCTLKCVFCQNHAPSHEGFGKDVSVSRLAEIFLSLQAQGAHNINLVTASHYLPSVIRALDLAKPSLHIPVVYNCGGYERIEAIRALSGYIDIYLPDLKYFDSRLSLRYSAAADYFQVASKAIREMIAQTDGLLWDESRPELLKKGVLIRHMVLPGAKEDSMKLLSWIAETLPRGKFLLSLLSQYTPFSYCNSYPEINRTVTSYEYQKVVDKALEFGLADGYMQKRSSAKEAYTPPFDLSGI